MPRMSKLLQVESKGLSRRLDMPRPDMRPVLDARHDDRTAPHPSWIRIDVLDRVSRMCTDAGPVGQIAL